MKILAVDGEPAALAELERLLREAEPDSEVDPCPSAGEALARAERVTFDAAFLEPSGEGLPLARQLMDRQPGLPVVFVSGSPDWAVEAFAIHAAGYLLKPVGRERLRRELDYIRGGRPPARGRPPAKRKVSVRTFGGFEVSVGGQRVVFGRKKAKELLAYLVERKGSSVTVREACGVLFEDATYDRAAKSYFHTILAALRRALREAGAEDILLKSYNSLAVDPDRLDCDYYRFLDGDGEAIGRYHGEFLPSYSWAEFTTAELDRRKAAYLEAAGDI